MNFFRKMLASCPDPCWPSIQTHGSFFASLDCSLRGLLRISLGMNSLLANIAKLDELALAKLTLAELELVLE